MMTINSVFIRRKVFTETWTQQFSSINTSFTTHFVPHTPARHTVYKYTIFSNAEKSKVKSFPEPQGPIGRRRSPFPVALSRTPADTARPQIRGYCIAWYARFLPSFRWYSLTDPGGMARWVGLGTEQPRAGVEPTTSRSQSPAPYHTAIAYHQKCCEKC